jgi:hypothetical protein
MKAAFVGALFIAAVSTLGDFIWAAMIPRHMPRYGLTHGALLFLCVGLYLGLLAKRPTLGAIGGAVIGLLAAGSFYVLAPVAGYSIMFVSWFGIWIALAVFNGRGLGRTEPAGRMLIRGVVAAIASGIAFYAVSGIWFPFRPRGWDYAVHFGAWVVAYLPGFLALLSLRRARADAGVEQDFSPANARQV